MLPLNDCAMKRFLFLLAFGLITLPGCDTLLEPEPVGLDVVDNVYQDLTGAVAGVNGVYVPLQSEDLYDQDIFRLTELASDNAWTYRPENETKRFQAEPSTDAVQDVWDAAFTGIARANVLLARVPAIPAAGNESLKNAILGQGYFLRAFYYFLLVRLYGDVPLITEEVKNPNDLAVSRAPVEAVYSRIKSDLEEAATRLPQRSQLNGSRGFERGRVTRETARALLAEVHLTLEEWQQAADAARAVIESGSYQLMPDYRDNFQGRKENNDESLLEVQFVAGQGVGLGSFLNNFFGPAELVSGNGLETLIPTDDSRNFGYPGDSGGGTGLVQAFEPGDRRFEASFSNFGLPDFFNANSGRPRHYLLTKYFSGKVSAEFQSGINVPVIRYAGVLLAAAEALAQLGRTDQAATYLNQVRARAGLQPVTTGDRSALLQTIYKERRTELAFEAVRFYDLNRWGILPDCMALQGITVNPNRISPHPITGKPQFLYPIPIGELTSNPQISQNPGY